MKEVAVGIALVIGILGMVIGFWLTLLYGAAMIIKTVFW